MATIDDVYALLQTMDTKLDALQQDVNDLGVMATSNQYHIESVSAMLATISPVYAYGVKLYVDKTTGNDNNQGSYESPFATIGKARSVAVADPPGGRGLVRRDRGGCPHHGNSTGGCGGGGGHGGGGPDRVTAGAPGGHGRLRGNGNGGNHDGYYPGRRGGVRADRGRGAHHGTPPGGHSNVRGNGHGAAHHVDSAGRHGLLRRAVGNGDVLHGDPPGSRGIVRAFGNRRAHDRERHPS